MTEKLKRKPRKTSYVSIENQSGKRKKRGKNSGCRRRSDDDDIDIVRRNTRKERHANSREYVRLTISHK